MEKAIKIDYCRLCKSKRLDKILDFGKTPPANSFLKKSELKDKEYFFPLVVNFCSDCGQLQLSHVVSPEILFRNYVFVSSTSRVTVEHFEDYAASVFQRLRLKKGNLVVDLGSNDGALLKAFQKFGVKVLGVDPARNVALRATKAGILTLPHFFTAKLAWQIARKYGKAKVITANNCFAHIDDLDEVVQGVGELLDQEGSFIIEAPYNVDLLEKNLFDIVYHEHLSYISITPLVGFFKKFGMKIFDVVKTPVHGGSVRIYVATNNSKHKINTSVRQFSNLEKRNKLGEIQTYREFAKHIKENKANLLALLQKIKHEGKSIAGYGAAAKTTTLLYHFGIGRELLDFIVDDSPYKQGLFSPGKHIPVLAPDALYTQKPDYVLILAWNFAQSIMDIHKKYSDEGGKFIVPVPKPVLS